MIRKAFYAIIFAAVLCTAAHAQETKKAGDKPATGQVRQDPYSSSPEEKEYLRKFIQAAKDNNKEDLKKYAPLVNLKKDYMYISTEISDNKENEQLIVNLLEPFYPFYKKDFIETTAKKQKMRGYGSQFVISASRLGQSHYRLGNIEEAKKYLLDVLEYDYSDYAIGTHAKIYTDILIKEGKKREALAVLEDQVIHHGAKYPRLLALIEPLNKELNPNISQEQVIKNLDARLSKNLQEKYRPEIISKEAPLFSLKDKNGVVHSLADLKGKVVVLDFWATWCSPCIASLPGMQAAMNKYKDDKEVVFLFIDCMEKKNFDYKKGVEEVLAQNKLNIPVIFDDMGPNSTADKLNLKSIPYKAIIDKKGFIRLESVGSSSDIETIVNEISAKIDLVKTL